MKCMLINFHAPYYSMATFQDFQKLDIRVGRIIDVEVFPEAKVPSYKLKIDLGKDVGIKRSCAQLVKNYDKEQLKGKLVLCVVNFPPKQIGPALSEVLTLGVPDENGECILIEPGKEVPLGGNLY
jgi:tRNA-binding protein